MMQPLYLMSVLCCFVLDTFLCFGCFLLNRSVGPALSEWGAYGTYLGELRTLDRTYNSNRIPRDNSQADEGTRGCSSAEAPSALPVIEILFQL